MAIKGFVPPSKPLQDILLAHEGESIIIVGLPHSGKTTLGRKIEALTKRVRRDTDEVVTMFSGWHPHEIIERNGMRGFRRKETFALKWCLEHPTKAVISTGGGIVESKASRTLIKKSGAIVIWLDTPLEIIADRLASHPQFDAATIAETAKKRNPWYQQLATYRVT